MRSEAVLACLLAPLAMPASTPDVELSAGYSWMDAQRTARHSIQGFFANVGVPLKPCVQLLFEAGLHHGDAPFVFAGDRGRQSLLELFAGPEYTRRAQRFTVFAHPLVGVAAWDLDGRVPVTGGTLPQNRNHVMGLALAFGGGLDVNLTPHLAIRAAQLDYVLTRFKDDTGTTGRYFAPWPFAASWQGSPRLAFGITVRFGSKD